MSNAPPRANGETYFFRDHGQFDLLRLRLLPELIERRRDTKALRLWSAGCASGEEAYSLAMLVDMLLPQRDGWEILILGADIDPVALAKAARGRYGQWSFRMAPPTLQQRYFRRAGDEWLLDERIRRMVSFRAVDLVGATFPAGDLCDMDLILCRNVFIYFDQSSVTLVANKLTTTLREGGYLMTGHTELIGHAMTNVRSRLFTEGVVYQRIAAPAPSAPPAAMALAYAPLTLVPPALPPGGAGPHLSQLPGAPHGSPHRAPNSSSIARMPPSATPGPDDLLTTARQLADRGEYAQAEQTCRQVLDLAPLTAAAHFLLAQLAQLRGDFEQAGQLLERTLYLDPDNVAAYLELAALCERADNLPRAQTLRHAALTILRNLPADAAIAPYEATAAQLAQWLEQ